MDETEQTEVRPASANSENSSENGFVEVTQEDAQMASQSWEDPSSRPVPAVDDEEDLYGAADEGDDGEEEGGGGEGEGEATAELEEEEKPLSPPPSPVTPDKTEQLIDFGFGDSSFNPPLATAPAAQPFIDDTPLVAMAPEPLVPTDQSIEITTIDTSSKATPLLGEERDHSPPPPPPPDRDPTPSPSPEREPTPPPPPLPARDPTPPPPAREPTPPPEKTSSGDSPGVEDVTPAPSAPASASAPQARLPKPRGYLKFLRALHPVVLYIMYWCDMKLSAVVLGVCLVVLLTLTLNTLLHTWVLLLLSFMVVSLTYIVSKIVIDSFYNRKVQNPFKAYLAKEITLPEDEMVEWTAYAIKRMEKKISYLVQLLLFANIKRSLAFGVGLWMASFVTNYVTLLSAMFVLVIVAFSVPWLYDHFQSHIDTHLEMVVTKVVAVVKKIVSYIPLGKTKAE